MKKTELKIGTPTCLILLTVSGIAGITALFLPFAEDESPVSLVFNSLPSWISDTEDWLYMTPWEQFPTIMAFFLPVFVSAAFVRWTISGLLSRPERAIAYVLSSMMSLGILYYIIEPLESLGKASSIVPFGMILVIFILASLATAPFTLLSWLISSILSLPLLFGVYIVVKNLKNNGPKEVSAVIAMQIAYLSNALLPLISFLGRWQIGAYFVVITAGVYLTQIVMATVKLGVFRRGGESGSV